MSSMFTSPGTIGSSEDRVSIANLDGHLLVIEPTEYTAEITTTLGPRDAVSATVHDITLGETHTDMLIFPKVLIGSLKGRIGERVLATLGKGTAKPGQSAPWLLTDMSTDPGAVADATRYLTDKTAATLTAPTAAPAAAAATQSVELTPELLAALGNLTAK